MAYLSADTMRIMQYGPFTVMDFFTAHCTPHYCTPVDDNGETRLCTICLEPLQAIAVSSSSPDITPLPRFRGRLTINNKCSHILHTSCIIEYLNNGNTCPICRCHWFDSDTETEKAWEIQAALQALDMFDYAYSTKAQKRIKIIVHAMVFDEMPFIVAHWLTKMPRSGISENHIVAGRVARSERGVELMEIVVVALRMFDGSRRRLGVLVKRIAMRAERLAAKGYRKGATRNDNGVFIRVVVELVVGYYAHSQGLMDAEQTRWQRLLSWLHLP